MYAISRKIIPSYDPIQFKGILMNEIEKMAKKLISGLIIPNLGPPFFLIFFFWGGLSLLALRHCSKLSSFAISRKTNEPNFREW